jgi:hypothetical protein
VRALADPALGDRERFAPARLLESIQALCDRVL